MDNGGAFYQEGSVGRQSLGGNSYTDGDKPKTDWDAQTITHMTCKQANELFLNSNTGTVQSASGREVVHVAVLGRILGVDQPGTKVKYTITDGTGPLVFASWLNNNNDEGFGDEGSANAKLTSFVAGKYITAMLRVNQSQQEGGIEFLALNGSIKLVEDFNEITFHNLKCLHVHLLNAHGSGASVGAGGQAGGSQVYHPEAKGYGKAVGLGGDNIGLGGGSQSFAGQVAGKAAAPGGELTSEQLRKEVYAVFLEIAQAAGKMEDGVHKDLCLKTLKSRGHSIGDLKFEGALEELSADGMLYSTTDDDHYAPTEQDESHW